MEERGNVATLASRASFDEIYRRYGGVVLHRCRMILGNDEALDATHDVFLRAIDRWDQFDPSRPLLPWLVQITTNLCIDRLRKRKRLAPLDEAADQIIDARSELDDRQLVRALLSRFDEKTQALVVYRYLDGMSQTAIAEMLGISEKTVARRLQRFKERADKWLARSVR